jgi:alpha-glucosidase
VGSWEALDAPDDVLAYGRREGGDRRVVLVSMADTDRGVPLDGDWSIEVASDGAGEGGPYEGRIGPDQGLVLRP